MKNKKTILWSSIIGFSLSTAIAVPTTYFLAKGSKKTITTEENKGVGVVELPELNAHKASTILDYKKYATDKLLHLTSDGTTPIDVSAINDAKTIDDARVAFYELESSGLFTPETNTPVSIAFPKFVFDLRSSSIIDDYKTSIKNSLSDVFINKIEFNVGDIKYASTNGVTAPWIIRDIWVPAILGTMDQESGVAPVGPMPDTEYEYDISQTPDYATRVIKWFKTGWEKSEGVDTKEIDAAKTIDEVTIAAQKLLKDYTKDGGTDASSHGLPGIPPFDSHSSSKVTEMIEYIKGHYEHIEFQGGTQVPLSELDTLTDWDSMNAKNDEWNNLGLQTEGTSKQAKYIKLIVAPIWDDYSDASVTEWVKKQKEGWSKYGIEEVSIANSALDLIASSTYQTNKEKIASLVLSATKSIYGFDDVTKAIKSIY